ncbi:MAG: hypothetical protein NW200_03940 [Hyphomonadaceae bacterium]|nr:hypothetical protein [Hyphomonadaceae bacterium]
MFFSVAFEVAGVGGLWRGSEASLARAARCTPADVAELKGAGWLRPTSHSVALVGLARRAVRAAP